MLAVPHLDREFDYLVPADQSDAAQPGVRVRVRFHGKLIDAFILERRDDTDHQGQLGWLNRVIDIEPVLTPEVYQLVEAVAARYAGTRPDVLRLAVPPRHGGAEKSVSSSAVAPVHPVAATPISDASEELSGWARYIRGEHFLSALRQGRAARAVWQALPGEQWAQRLIDAAVAALAAGRGVLIVVPDQRDIDRIWHAATAVIDPTQVVALSAGLGPQARYRRWLSVLRGHAHLVIGTRSAVFAPVMNLGAIFVWDDGDDSLVEPRAPYPHAREVALLRAHQLGCAVVIGGYTRTTQAHALVRRGWAHDLVSPRSVVRSCAPRVVALDDSGYADERDAAARTARLPSVALSAARAALQRDTPVLVQVPRRGYVPSVACAQCRTVARCRHCMGPLGLPESSSGSLSGYLGECGSVVCRWCGRVDASLRCRRCGSTKIRAAVVGARRTAEELGRAFPGIPVVTSVGDAVHSEVGSGAMLVIATPGAEPAAVKGYGAALLLDCWALLGRQDLRAGEDTLRRWMAAAAQVHCRGDGGVVVVVAESMIPEVQFLLRWDPLGHAEVELNARAEVGLPPAVQLAVVDGVPSAVSALLEYAQLPASVEVMGPVDLPVGARRPHGVSEQCPVVRMVLRVPRDDGAGLAAALHQAVVAHSAHPGGRSGGRGHSRHDAAVVRVQIDPLHIG